MNTIRITNRKRDRLGCLHFRSSCFQQITFDWALFQTSINYAPQSGCISVLE